MREMEMKGIWAIQGKLGEEGIVYESLFLVDGEETEYLGEFATEKLASEAIEERLSSQSEGVKWKTFFENKKEIQDGNEVRDGRRQRDFRSDSRADKEVQAIPLRENKVGG